MRRETLLQLIEVAHVLPPAPALQLLRALRSLTADPALLLPLYVRTRPGSAMQLPCCGSHHPSSAPGPAPVAVGSCVHAWQHVSMEAAACWSETEIAHERTSHLPAMSLACRSVAQYSCWSLS